MDERLTKRNPDGSADFANCAFENICYDLSLYGRETVRNALEELAQYEDAKEQRQLVILPLAIGDWAYRIGFNGNSQKPEIVSEKVISVEISDLCGVEFISRRDGRETSFRKADIGTRVFLTYAEAEAALKAKEAKA